jgi:hypothetical protein
MQSQKPKSTKYTVFKEDILSTVSHIFWPIWALRKDLPATEWEVYIDKMVKMASGQIKISVRSKIKFIFTLTVQLWNGCFS